MCTDKAEIYTTQIVTVMSDQAVLVSLDIEHHPVSREKTCCRIPGFDVLRKNPRRMQRFRVPHLQWLFCVRVLLPEIPERFSGDDTHTGRISCSLYGNKGPGGTSPSWKSSRERHPEMGTRHLRKTESTISPETHRSHGRRRRPC